MGHTRMTTQGNEANNKNNHPFTSHTLNFALAHNGVLYNDRDLRRKLSLPQTPIETDSYIAVQLIEQQKAINFNSLRYMAEKVEGSFVFTLLDIRLYPFDTLEKFPTRVGFQVLGCPILISDPFGRKDAP